MRHIEKAAIGISCAVAVACSVNVSTGPEAASATARPSRYDPTPEEAREDSKDRQAAIDRKKPPAATAEASPEKREGGADGAGANSKARQAEPAPPRSDAPPVAIDPRVKEFYDCLANQQRAVNEGMGGAPACSPPKEPGASAEASVKQQVDPAKEDSCRSEYTALVAAENLKASRHPPELVDPMASCSTGIPTGTYKYVGSSGYVTISVDANGCATYEAGQQRTWKRTRVVESDLGDRQLEYTKAVYCVVSGTASGKPKVKAQPKKFSDASMCYDGILAKDKTWVVSRGATPQLSVTLTGGTRVSVRQVSKAPEIVQPPEAGAASGQAEMFGSMTSDAPAKTEAMGWCAKLQRWNSGERALSNARGYE